MVNNSIFYGGGFLLGIIQWFVKDKIKQNETKIKELHARCEIYDQQILKFNDKYSAINEKIKNIEHNAKNDQQNTVQLFNVKFEQILKEYSDIKLDMRELKSDVKQILNERK